MCIMLNLDYVKFSISNLFFFSKVIKEKPLGDRVDQPLGKGRVKGLGGSFEPLKFFLDNSKTSEDFLTKF